MPVPRRVRDRVRLEQRLDLVDVPVEPGGADVDEGVRTRALVAEAGGQSQRPLAPGERRVHVLREHRQLGDDAVGARELRRRAERLQDRDRLERRRVGGLAVACDPVVARHRPRGTDPRPPGRPGFGRSRSRARCPRTPRRDGRSRTRPRRAPPARPPARREAAGRRSARRAGSGSTPRGSRPTPPPAARRRARTRRPRPLHPRPRRGGRCARDRRPPRAGQRGSRRAAAVAPRSGDST